MYFLGFFGLFFVKVHFPIANFVRVLTTFETKPLLFALSRPKVAFFGRFHVFQCLHRKQESEVETRPVSAIFADFGLSSVILVVANSSLYPFQTTKSRKLKAKLPTDTRNKPRNEDRLLLCPLSREFENISRPHLSKNELKCQFSPAVYQQLAFSADQLKWAIFHELYKLKCQFPPAVYQQIAFFSNQLKWAIFHELYKLKCQFPPAVHQQIAFSSHQLKRSIFHELYQLKCQFFRAVYQQIAFSSDQLKWAIFHELYQLKYQFSPARIASWTYQDWSAGFAASV